MSNVYLLRSREDFWVFEEHLRHRQAVQLTAKPRAEFTRLQSQMARLRQINSDVLPLAEELSKGAVESQLAKSDFQLRSEALLRMANEEDPMKEKCFIKGESHATCSQ